MSTIVEIEAAVEKLPPQGDELAVCLEHLRLRRVNAAALVDWLQQARGAALPGVTTAGM